MHGTKHGMARSLGFAAAGLLLAIGLNSASASAAENIHQLAGAPSRFSSVEGRDYRLVAAHPKDASGQVLTDIPAWRIDVRDSEGEWEENSDAKLPAWQPSIPAALRPHITLMHANAVGWIIVPRGWRVQRAVVGDDGNAIFNFIAPAGAATGWLTLEEIPACMGCMYSAADGILPDAHKLHDALMETSTPKPTLSPKPDSLSYPNRCTARLAYRPAQSPAVQAVLMLDQRSDPNFSAIYAALPGDQVALTNFILATHRTAHTDCAL
ncbi:DUF4850 domain-containing protein [Dyella tabacisoli]|uniref:DUF4850 domain-containing protein n=1 Tax=Dyella tabacisoli TaxID=2282381 RepID=A0A369UNZ8_9GAMM|nr:DUF4850 domain-containing protein [Dyella tabacisoli]RDD82261.1 DUF4850 domain-containing protein [Dyella tabacisoli]